MGKKRGQSGVLVARRPRNIATVTPRAEVAMPKVLFAVPCERSVMVEAMDGIVQNSISVASRVSIGWGLLHFDYTVTDMARNSYGHGLLESECDALCMLDSDHKHAEDTVLRLAATMAVTGAKIVAGLAYRRKPSKELGWREPMAYMFANESQLRPIVVPKEPCNVIVDAVATAIILIHREVFEAMEPPWFKYEYYQYDQGERPSEDITFFRRLRSETGTKYAPLVNTGIVSPHLRVETEED